VFQTLQKMIGSESNVDRLDMYLETSRVAIISRVVS